MSPDEDKPAVAEYQPLLKHHPKCKCSTCQATREAEITREAQAEDSSVSSVRILNSKTGARVVEHRFQPGTRYIPLGSYAFQPEQPDQELFEWEPDPFENQGAARHCNVLKGLRLR